jgi:OOP family OmpA-OmpF porin
MRKLSIAVFGAAAMALALPALAQRTSDWNRVYFGLDAGKSKFTDACNGIPGCDNKDTQFGAFVGYRLNPNFAIEGGYHDLGKASAPGADYKANALEADVLASWPVANRFSVYGKLGAVRGQAKAQGFTENNTELTFGVGAQFDVTRNLGVRAEWQRYNDFGGDTLAKTDIDVLRVGALWQFQ